MKHKHFLKIIGELYQNMPLCNVDGIFEIN